MTKIEQLHVGIQAWKKLGWLPYCPNNVRKYISFIPFYMPYNLMRRKIYNGYTLTMGNKKNV
jgi:hypothetical protein